MTRVLLVDDPVTRRGLAAALGRAGMETCAEAGDAEEAVALAATTAPELCLVGEGADGDAAATAAELVLAAPDAVVVLLVAAPDGALVLDALRAGARGCLPRDIAPDRLGPALQGVLDGELGLTRRDLARVVEGLLPGLGRPSRFEEGVGRLTGREAEVLTLLRQGLGTAEIAERLHISPVTVRRHASKLMHKARVSGRAGLLG